MKQPREFLPASTASSSHDDAETTQTQTQARKKSDSSKSKTAVTTAVPPLTRMHAGSSEMIRDLLAKLTSRDNSRSHARQNAMNAKRGILPPPHPFASLPHQYTTPAPYPYHAFDPLRSGNSFLNGHNAPDYSVGGSMFLHAPRQPYMPSFPTPRTGRSATANARLRQPSHTDFANAARKMESQVESLSFDMFCRCHQPEVEVSNPKLSVATARLHLLRIWGQMQPSDKQPYTDIAARKIFYRLPNVPNFNSMPPPYDEPSFPDIPQMRPPFNRFPVPVPVPVEPKRPAKEIRRAAESRMRPLRPEEAIAKPLQTAEVAATAVADKKLEDSAEEETHVKEPKASVEPPAPVKKAAAAAALTSSDPIPVTVPPKIEDSEPVDKSKIPPLVHNGVVAAQKLVNMGTNGMAMMRLKPTPKPRRRGRSKSAGKRRRNKHRMRDPFAPRRPWNAYAFFVSCNQELLKSQMPNKTQCERMRVMGQNWKSLPQEARQIYKDLELKDKTRFANERMRYEALKRANIQPLSTFELGVLGDPQPPLVPVPITYPKIPDDVEDDSRPEKRRRQ